MVDRASYVRGALSQISKMESECGPVCVERREYHKLILGLRLIKAEAFDKLQRTREDFRKLFIPCARDLADWESDLKELADDKELALKEFFEANIEDNKTTAFYLRYIGSAMSAYIQQSRTAKGELVYDDATFNRLLDSAVKDTIYDFERSHEVWDVVFHFRETQKDQYNYATLKNLYLQRLQIPHKKLSQTFGNYSKFVSTYNNNHYEQEMLQGNKAFRIAHRDQSDVDTLELMQATYEDYADFWVDYMDYYATKPKKQRKLEPITAIFERAVHESRRDSYIKVWMRYIRLLFDFGVPNEHKLSILKRFIRQFPKSPLPYAEYIQITPSLPLTEDTHQDIAFIKQRLHKTGLIFEVKPYEEWSALFTSLIVANYKLGQKGERRYAEELIVDLHMGFTEAIKNCTDVYHKVERLCITVTELTGNIDYARGLWRQVTEKFGQEAENWLLAHNFEKKNGSYEQASKILQAAITRAETLDWPERIFEEALQYENIYGTVESYRQVQCKIDKKKQDVAEKRENDNPQNPDEEEKLIGHLVKRKADDDLETTDDEANKKQKVTTHRDRENLTILVTGIPENTTESQILRFFKDCGEIKGHFLGAIDNTLSAKIEFADEQTVLRALTKDHKKFRGSEIRVQKAYKTTVWVTNFPPSFTTDSIQNLFGSIGKIASVRFPSLKFNSQRRFCYVEFFDSKHAAESQKLDGTEVDGYKLVVKISDPESKTARKGPTEEGRELYVSKLDIYKVTGPKLKKLFEKYGFVERITMPWTNRDQGRKNDGYAFVAFRTPEAAQAALELDSVNFEGRIIEVSLSKTKSEKEQEKELQALKNNSIKDNAIALLNVPDIINATQLKDICSEAGEVEQVILEPEHEGAIVQFKNPQDAGKAALKLEAKNLGAYTLQVGTVQDLRNRKVKTTSSTSRPMIPSSLRRKQAFQKTATTIKASSSTTIPSDSSSAGRTNDDFRAMLSGKK